jgi:hypothetical protein
MGISNVWRPVPVRTGRTSWPAALTRKADRAGHRRHLPALEGLEDRIVLSPTVYTVTSWGDSPGDPQTATSGDLRYCIKLANANTSNPDGSSIEFDPSVFSLPRTINLSGGLTLNNTKAATTITGPSESSLTVSGGGNSSNFAVFTVDPSVTATISYLTITNGYHNAGNGGGVANYGTTTLTYSTVSGNNASLGGGIYDAVGGIMAADFDTIANNNAPSGPTDAEEGGGVFDGWLMSLVNDTIVGNSASADGGGVDVNDATSVLINDTIIDNSAPGINVGGGIYVSGGTNVSTSLYNTIVAGSPSGGDIGGWTVSGSYNVIDAASAGGLINGVDGNIVGGGVKPDLGSLADNGGPTQTMAELPGSPTIGKGSVADATYPSGNPLANDQRGSPYVRVLNNTVDIGAFEVQPAPPSLVVNTLADSPTSGSTTLRQALANAATLGGSQTVSFASGLTGSIDLSSALEITSNVTIAGPGAASLTVSGGGASSNFNVFFVDSGVTATISGLTIANANTTDPNGSGGIYNSGTLTLSSDIFSGNSGSFGGGILNSGTAVLTGCTLTGDSAVKGGGGVCNTGTITLMNDTITQESAAYGGGVYNSGSATLTNVTLAADPTNSGGALINYNTGTMTLDNTIIANRTSGGDIAGTVSGSSNLIDDSATAGGLTNGLNGNLVGIDPVLGPLGKYGGPTQTLPLLPGSPAIDAGNSSLAVDAQGNPLTTDQRGLPRVVGTAVDIGAFESSGFALVVSSGNNQSSGLHTPFANPLQVTVTPNNPGDPVNGGVVTFTAPGSGASATLSPSGPVTITSGIAAVTATANGVPGGPYAVTAATTEAAPVSFSLTNTGSRSLVVTTLADSPTSGSTTLRQALANAATLGGSQTVSFAPGLTGTIQLSSGLEISSNMTIAGPGASSLTVSGGGASSDFSVFTVDSSVTATISGLTIANANTTDPNGSGGIYNSGTLTLSSDILSGNSGSYGGGILNWGTAVLTGCTLTGDSAAKGGGGVCNGGTITLINDTITGESAAYGGGVYNFGGSATLTNVTLSSDPSNSYGALLNNSTSTLTLNNTIVANSASGGDIAGTVSGSNNLIDDSATAGGLTNSVNGNLVRIAPGLGPLGNYGGPTPTLPLLPGSPAIDAGNSSLAVDAQGNPLTTDQRGLPRVVGTAVDIGAFESSGFTLAVAAGNNQSTLPGTAFPTALEVTVTPVNAGDPVDGGTITFTAPSGTGASATLVPANPVTIAGGSVTVAATANANPGGPYSVVATTSGAVAPASFSLANLRPALVTCVSSVPSPTYGQSLTFTATVSPTGGGPTPTGTVQFVIDGSNFGSVALVNGAATSAAATALAAGVRAVTVDYSGDGFYGSSTVSFNQSVGKAHLTVTAEPQTKVYGQANPALTATLTGFVNGDSAAVVSGSPALSTTATTASGVGQYPITVAVGSLSATNYDFASLVAGTLTITPANLTVTANPQSMVYGAAVPVLTATISGFVNGDTTQVVSGAPTLTTTATPASHVSGSPYAITVSAGTLWASNYSFTFVSGSMTVTPAPLTITANNATMMCGAAVPKLSVSYSGFVNGDSPAGLTKQPTLSTSATPSSPAGAYAIVPSGASSPDYTANYVDGALTIIAAPVRVMGVTWPKIRMGKSTKTTQVIVLQFSGALNARCAQSINSYILATIPANKKQKSQPVLLSQAQYNAAAKTVTLITSKPLVLNPPLRLTICAAKLLDYLGRPLHGGVNYATTIP